MNPTIFASRRQRLADGLADGESLLIFAGRPPHFSADAFYPFAVHRHFYYLTGLNAPHLVLLLSRSGGKLQEILFCERPDSAAERWTGARLRAEKAAEISGIGQTLPLDAFPESLARRLGDAPAGRLWLDLFRPAVDLPDTPSLALARRLRDEWPGLVFCDLGPELARLRSVKDDGEVAAIEAAGRLTHQGLDALCASLEPGIGESVLEAALRGAWLSAGCREPAFPPIIAGGANATILHYEENRAMVPPGSLVLVDCGATCGLYRADVSRTFPVDGRFTPRQRELYDIVLAALTTTTAAVRPGISTVELNDITRGVLAAGAKRAGLIRQDSELDRYYYHGVSHHLGLDAHDPSPGRHAPLAAGMVITVEPGLYIAEEEIGIRLEDDVLVTDEGFRNLTGQIPREAVAVEDWIARARGGRGRPC